MTHCKIVDRHVDTVHGEIFVRQWLPANPLSPIPLILLHDSLGCVELWRDFPEHLAITLGRPVLAYDRLGFGRSSARVAKPSANFITEEVEIYFPCLAEALALSEFILVGHSVGGVMALLIAPSYPGCKMVISLAAQAFVEQRTLDGIRAAKEAFKQVEQFNKLTKLHRDKSAWVLSGWTETWLSADFVDWNIRKELQSITCPVLAIHGELDEFGSSAFPETITRRVAGISKMVLLDGCGHVPHKERRACTLESILEFSSQINE